MFYCEACQRKNKWPEGFRTSRGRCECCGKTAECFDVPSSALPATKLRKLLKDKASVHRGDRD